MKMLKCKKENLMMSHFSTLLEMYTIPVQPLANYDSLPQSSGVTLLEGARGQGMVRCPTD